MMVRTWAVWQRDKRLCAVSTSGSRWVVMLRRFVNSINRALFDDVSPLYDIWLLSFLKITKKWQTHRTRIQRLLCLWYRGRLDNHAGSHGVPYVLKVIFMYALAAHKKRIYSCPFFTAMSTIRTYSYSLCYFSKTKFSDIIGDRLSQIIHRDLCVLCFMLGGDWSQVHSQAFFFASSSPFCTRNSRFSFTLCIVGSFMNMIFLIISPVRFHSIPSPAPARSSSHHRSSLNPHSSIFTSVSSREFEFFSLALSNKRTDIGLFFFYGLYGYLLAAHDPRAP